MNLAKTFVDAYKPKMNQVFLVAVHEHLSRYNFNPARITGAQVPPKGSVLMMNLMTDLNLTAEETDTGFLIGVGLSLSPAEMIHITENRIADYLSSHTVDEAIEYFHLPPDLIYNARHRGVVSFKDWPLTCKYKY